MPPPFGMWRSHTTRSGFSRRIDLDRLVGVGRLADHVEVAAEVGAQARPPDLVVVGDDHPHAPCPTDATSRHGPSRTAPGRRSVPCSGGASGRRQLRGRVGRRRRGGRAAHRRSPRRSRPPGADPSTRLRAGRSARGGDPRRRPRTAPDDRRRGRRGRVARHRRGRAGRRRRAARDPPARHLQPLRQGPRHPARARRRRPQSRVRAGAGSSTWPRSTAAAS